MGSTDSEVKVDTPVVADSDAAVELNGIEPAIAVENVLSDEKKVKPKKKKKKEKGEKVTQNGDVSDLTTTVQEVDVQQSESIVKKKRRRKTRKRLPKTTKVRGLKLKVMRWKANLSMLKLLLHPNLRLKLLKRRKSKTSLGS